MKCTIPLSLPERAQIGTACLRLTWRHAYLLCSLRTTVRGSAPHPRSRTRTVPKTSRQTESSRQALSSLALGHGRRAVDLH